MEDPLRGYSGTGATDHIFKLHKRKDQKSTSTETKLKDLIVKLGGIIPTPIAGPTPTAGPASPIDPSDPERSRAEPSDLAKKASLTPPLPAKLKRLAERPEEINFLMTTYSPRLPLPKHDEDKHTVILWRGCSAQQLMTMVRAGSAGGEEADPATKAPTEREAVMQVAETDSLPEFTSDTVVANAFGRGNFVVAVELSTSHLTRGSSSERGYVCARNTPVQILAWKQGDFFR